MWTNRPGLSDDEDVVRYGAQADARVCREAAMSNLP